MIVLETILAFVLLIGVLVFIHELGHFLAARWTGMRAEVFAVGMGPRLLGYNKVTGFTFGKLHEDIELGDHTDYRISAFPIGGYVKIAGMVDESMDTKFAQAPPQPWEFRSKNTLQKAFVISAGVLMNFLLAVIVLAGVNYFNGKDVVATTAVGELEQTSPLYASGLRSGDSILRVNGKPVDYYEQLQERIYVEEAHSDVTLDVLRNGTPTTVRIPRKTLGQSPEKVAILPRVNVKLMMVENGRPAHRAGVKAGDVVLAVDGVPVTSQDQMRKYVSQRKSQPIELTIARDGETVTKTVTPGDDGLIGVQLGIAPRKHVRYGLGESMVAGFDETVALTGSIFKGIGALVSGNAKVSESVAGPAMIAQAAQRSAREGAVPFLRLLVIISIGLACMNILPIPALDGGHLVFIIVEGVLRREVPVKIRMAIQNVGFVLLILLMAFVLYNDTSKMLGN